MQRPAVMDRHRASRPFEIDHLAHIDLGDVFGAKAFAVTILLLMFLPALPLPTGGVTHVFEVITILLAGQMVLGRRTIWLPERTTALALSWSLLPPRP